MIDNLRYWVQDRGRCLEACNALSLTPFLHTKAAVLSGGYARRLSLAIAQAQRPELLIMDEPLTGVDIDTRYLFLDWVRTLAASGVCVIYTTHHADEIAGTANALGIVYRGGFKWIPDITGLYLENLICRFIHL